MLYFLKQKEDFELISEPRWPVIRKKYLNQWTKLPNSLRVSTKHIPTVLILTIQKLKNIYSILGKI